MAEQSLHLDVMHRQLSSQVVDAEESFSPTLRTCRTRRGAAARWPTVVAAERMCGPPAGVGVQHRRTRHPNGAPRSPGGQHRVHTAQRGRNGAALRRRDPPPNSPPHAGTSMRPGLASSTALRHYPCRHALLSTDRAGTDITGRVLGSRRHCGRPVPLSKTHSPYAIAPTGVWTHRFVTAKNTVRGSLTGRFAEALASAVGPSKTPTGSSCRSRQ